MSKGDTKVDNKDNAKPEQYEKYSAATFFCGASAALRQIYFLYKDAELTGEADHELVKTYIDCLIYNLFTAEEKIKEKSVNKPTPHEETEPHSRKLWIRMKQNLDEFYFKQRQKARERLR